MPVSESSLKREYVYRLPATRPFQRALSRENTSTECAGDSGSRGCRIRTENDWARERGSLASPQS
eukprot:351297-Chlamydomonas_euryale.AAC.6